MENLKTATWQTLALIAVMIDAVFVYDGEWGLTTVLAMIFAYVFYAFFSFIIVSLIFAWITFFRKE